MPPRILTWFHRIEQKLQQKPQQQPPRVDYYLNLGGYDSLGIKLREGRIEIKQREAEHGTVHLGRRLAGMMERWRKWSWALTESDTSLVQGWIASPAWVGVEKKRWLLMYQTSREEGIAPALEGKVVEQGCQVELASIEAQGHAGWSLSFEGFGGEASGRETLLLVAAHLFNGEPADLPLSTGNSYGYPKWLAMLGNTAPVSE